MPPKKVVDVTKVSITGDEATPAKESARDGVNIEDYSLPKSIVTRLAKGVLPPNTSIAANSVLAMTKGATVFVSYLSTQHVLSRSHVSMLTKFSANEFAHRDGRKTLNPNDIFRALDELEFPDFKPRLEAELAKFNDIQAEKKNATKNKAATMKVPGKLSSPAPDGEDDGDGEPAAKKARIEESGSPEGEEVQSEMEDEEAQDEEEEEEDAAEEDEQNQDEDMEQPAERSDDEALDNGDDSD